MKGGDAMLKIGTVLKACRERAGYSQEELAHLMNRTQACISKYENDRKIPDAQTFMDWFRLTNTQEVAVAFFFGVDGLTAMQQILSMLPMFINFFSKV